MTLLELNQYLENRAGTSLKSDEGVQFGEAHREIERLLFAWLPNWDAVRRAVQTDSTFLVGHESFFYPYNANIRTVLDPSWKDWSYNRERLHFLKKHSVGYCRYHYIADALSIFEDVARRLGLDSPIVDKPDFVKIFASEPTAGEEWVERAKTAFSLERIRVAWPKGMDLKQKFSRIGLPWGGMGLNVNVSYIQALLEAGADLLIAGETDNMAMQFAVDQGIPVIETSHDMNEIPGYKAFSRLIMDAFPDLQIQFLHQECVWKVR